MGAFADYDAYLAALRQNRAADFQMSAAAGRNLRLSALWRSFLPAPAIPTTSVALNDTSDVAIGPLPSVNTGQLTLLAARANPGGNSGVALIVADILNHSGGMPVPLQTTMTAGLPTAPLTRCISGEGVMAGVIIHSTLATATQDVTISYTNQSGTSGRVSTPTTIATTNFREAGAILPIPLAGGDTGVRSVESVTISSGGIATGEFGIVLFKPLAMIACNNFEGAHVVDAVSTGGFIGALAQSEPGACISLIAIMNTAQIVSGALLFAEV